MVVLFTARTQLRADRVGRLFLRDGRRIDKASKAGRSIPIEVWLSRSKAKKTRPKADDCTNPKAHSLELLKRSSRCLFVNLAVLWL